MLETKFVDDPLQKKLHAKNFRWFSITIGPFSDFILSCFILGLLLSSFFYGYIFTQIPGGWLATKYGGKNLFGGGILATALFTLITPPAARISPYLLASVRILEGLCEVSRTN